MKVLHLVKTSDGAAWVVRLTTELVKRGVEVHVALPMGGARMPYYIEGGVHIHEMQYDLKKVVSTCRNLNKIIEEIQPDIIHSHFFITSIFMRLAGFKDKRPRIFHVPGPLHLEHFFFRTLDVKLAHENDYWIGTCKWTVERYKKSGIPPHRLFLSYYGTNYEEIEYEKGKIREEYNLGDDAIIVAMVAFMYPPKRYIGQKRGIKGHEDFIDAISILSKENPNIYGVCIGGGSLSRGVERGKAYEKQVKEYGKKKCGDHLIFMGTRSNVRELYKDVDIAVCASYSENIGGASEPLSFGVPIIATKVGGLPDIVIDGKTGYLINPGKPLEIVDAVRKMIKDPEKRAKMVQAGQLHRSSLSNKETYINDSLNIYNQILKEDNKN